MRKNDLSVPGERSFFRRGGSRQGKTPISEAIAAFMGTTAFIYWMALLVAAWFLWNTLAPVSVRFDPYPFQFLTLVLSVQASFAAPLILLAQYSQEQRDRAQAVEDRRKLEQSRADTDFVARELMDLRRQLGEMSSRQFVTKRLDAMEERLLEAIGSATAPIPVEGVAEDDRAHRDHGGGQHSSQASNRHHERP